MKEFDLDNKSPDIAEENIQKLRQIFPDVFTEDKVDFDKLQQVLGNYVDDSKERYNFTWNGKGDALRFSQTPSLGTLRPCKEESKDWDTTENLYIEGDNLEVLKLLQKSYHGKIKMIYIDPPYNTGKDFVYKDDFRDSIRNYQKITGQVDIEGNRVSTNTEASGRYHTDWLNMMYPRLRLARNLLAEDGVIFISIDNNEKHNLMKLCDEVFGEDNFVGEIIWAKGNAQNDALNIQENHETVFAYKKSYLTIFETKTKTINVDKDSYGFYYKGYSLTTGGEGGLLNARPNLGSSLYYNPENKDIKIISDYDIELAKISNDEHVVYKDNSELLEQGYEIIRPPKKGKSLGCWTWDKSRMEKDKHELLVSKTRTGFSLYRKIYVLAEDVQRIEGKDVVTIIESSPIKSLINESSGNGTKAINELFGGKVFNNTKPVNLIKALINYTMKDNSIILDFFSGSSTTAHAVMQLNAEDEGNRKFIMVQLPEQTNEKSEAYQASYENICEIGKERIRRAGEKIKEENKDKEGIEKLDVGFKVLKLDTSNIRKWQPDYEDLERSLLDYTNNYVEGRTELDVVYEIMLKYGLDLTYRVDEYTIAGKKVYSIGYGMLMICLDNEITTEVAKGILDKVEELKPEIKRVVFKDNGFKSDSNKTNIKEILKIGGIEEFITL